MLFLAVAGAGVIWYLHGRGDSLADATLAGARQVKGVVCLDVAGDFSASMDDSVDTRNSALAMLKPFMAREMGPDDLLTTVRFANTASLALAPTRAADLTRAADELGSVESGQYTYFIPAIKALDRGHDEAGGDCVRRILVAITDGEFADDMDQLVPLVRHFDQIYLAVPDQPAGYRPRRFAADARLATVVSEGFDDAEALSLLYGKALAAATGQRLAHR